MVQYLASVLRFDRLSGRKSGIERLGTVFDAAPGVGSREKADGVDSHESTKTWQEDMKERLGGWWW
jgi:hypothetical protein